MCLSSLPEKVSCEQDRDLDRHHRRGLGFFFGHSGDKTISPRSIPINNTRCQSSKNNLPSCGSISSKRDKMKGVNFATALARPSQWTCRKCLVQARGVREAIRQPKQYSTGTNQIPRPKNRGRLVLAATGATLGVGAFVYQDEARHAYYGIQRSGRVLGTLAVCINE
jgi:hypothetical protein